MCGRFQLSVKGKQISERYNIEVFDEMYKPNYNCSPGQILPVITNAEPEKLSFYKWGLIPYWAKDPSIGNKLINTRSETITEKPSFKSAFSARRCLIPANGFYEWKKGPEKTPFRIFLNNNSIFSMAGLWESWKDANGRILNSFSIITTQSNDIIRDIHHRMPVILNPDDEYIWMNEKDSEKLRKLLCPFPNDKMLYYPINKYVNNIYNNGEELITPASPGQIKLDL